MWEDVRRCEKMWEDVRRCEKMWEDVRRCEKMWEDVQEGKRARGEDVRRCEKMWEDVRRCEKMWEDVRKMWEDVRRCEKMWEDVRRCEKMWEDVRRCEKMWERCEKDVRRCEKMWEDVRRCEKMWEDVRRCEKMWEDVRRCEKMWKDVRRCEKMRRCFTDPHYWKNPALRRSREIWKKIINLWHKAFSQVSTPGGIWPRSNEPTSPWPFVTFPVRSPEAISSQQQFRNSSTKELKKEKLKRDSSRLMRLKAGRKKTNYSIRSIRIIAKVMCLSLPCAVSLTDVMWCHVALKRCVQLKSGTLCNESSFSWKTSAGA